mgnify:CR=1 FL=1
MLLRFSKKHEKTRYYYRVLLVETKIRTAENSVALIRVTTAKSK